MKKIVLIFFALFLCSGVTYSNFSGYSYVGGEKSFTKPHGINELKVYEEYDINPFDGKDVKKIRTVCNGNACPCGPSGCSYTSGYTVNGVTFNSTHPDYRSAGSMFQLPTADSSGIITFIRSEENTFTRDSDNILMPRLATKVRKYYTVPYRHDTTSPTCNVADFYSDASMTTPFTYGGEWLSGNKYYVMTCEDAETACQCPSGDSTCFIDTDGKVKSEPQILGHLMTPTSPFTNGVNLLNPACEAGAYFPKVLFDLKTPEVEMKIGSEDFNLNLLANRNYIFNSSGALVFKTKNDINVLATEDDINIEITEDASNLSVYGISGIKEYSIEILKIKDELHNSITPMSIYNTGVIMTSQYNPDGLITIADIRTININKAFTTQSGKYRIKINAQDWAGNYTRVQTDLNIYPENIYPTNSSIASTLSGTKYANNSDTYEYIISLNDKYNNPVFSRNLDIPVIQSINGYSGGNEINLSNTSSGLRYDYSSPIDIDASGKYRLEIRSLQPGTMTERFVFTYRTWDKNYIQNGGQTSAFITSNRNVKFLKPLLASISIKKPSLSAPIQLPRIGFEQEYFIDVVNTGSLGSFSNAQLEITKPKLRFKTQHSFMQLNDVTNTFSTSNYRTGFKGIFDATNSGAVLLEPEIEINDMNVSYNLAGENIIYPLDTFGIAGCYINPSLGLKTVGITQFDGKALITGGNENFSDIPASELRNKLRENTYRMIRGLESGDTVGKIKYVEGDIEISGDQSGYETLVVRNGNIIISGNLNPSKSKLGLIAISDEGYDISSHYRESKGNIYVSNNVSEINAIIYADGTFRSAKTNGDSYIDIELTTKLHLNGSLFTRNTVGGGIQGGGMYILPGGSKTTNITLPKIYDLHFVRNAMVCGEADPYSFKVHYDSSIHFDPPEGFNIN